MGLSREDLVYDLARHVDSSVHMFEEWGLPIFKNEDGRYKREGRWQIMIHGESYKPIVAEAAKAAIGDGNLYERVFVAHPLLDADDPTRIAGVVGFSVRDYKVIIFKAKAVISCGGGATGVYRPRAQGEGLGRIWYAPWNTGSAYAMQIRAGAKMTQMEHRLVVARFKDGYGPVGMWFLLFKSQLKNSLGQIAEEYRAHELEEWAPYGTAKPVPTPLRNHLMLNEIKEGAGPALPADRRGPAADVHGGPERPQEDRRDRVRRLGGLPGHDDVPGAHLGVAEHRPVQDPVGARSSPSPT